MSLATKDRIFALCDKGHNASSARHAYETELMLDCAEQDKNIQQLLADRAINLNVGDYNRLYDKWRVAKMGDENGSGLIRQLELQIEQYNGNTAGKA